MYTMINLFAISQPLNAHKKTANAIQEMVLIAAEIGKSDKHKNNNNFSTYLIGLYL